MGSAAYCAAITDHNPLDLQDMLHSHRYKYKSSKTTLACESSHSRWAIFPSSEMPPRGHSDPGTSGTP